MLFSLIGSTPTVAESLVTVLSTAFQTIATNLGTVLTTIAPIAVSVLGAGMVLKFGVRWFQRLTSRI